MGLLRLSENRSRTAAAVPEEDAPRASASRPARPGYGMARSCRCCRPPRVRAVAIFEEWCRRHPEIAMGVRRTCGRAKLRADLAPRWNGFIPHNCPRKRSERQESWSEWQDLNLRPPRPERGALPDGATLRLRWWKSVLGTRPKQRRSNPTALTGQLGIGLRRNQIKVRTRIPARIKLAWPRPSKRWKVY
jgi:hypothetical protein